MFRTPENRISDLERKAGTQTDKRFLVIIDNNREEAEVESFGHVLADEERAKLERVEIRIEGTHVDPEVGKRLEEIAARNASEPPWQPQTYADKLESEFAPPDKAEGTQTQSQADNETQFDPEIYAQRDNQALSKILERY